MAVIYGTPLVIGSGGGQNLTLPPMVTNLTAKGGNETITVSWTNPISDALAGIAVVYNSDHEPERPSDGTKVDAGLVETVDLTGLDNGILYYIRIFPYNEKKQYQTLIDGATATATPNVGPAQVTNFQVTGSGASPVLTWVNPTDDPLYHETVVIQKVGSAPTSLTDGTEIYRGTGTTVTASDLVRLEEYYFAVFTIDEAGSHRSPVVSEMYSYDFPAEPTSYSEIEQVTTSKTFIAPEDGWFEFIGLAVSGKGGASASRSWGVLHVGGGGGGGAGGVVVSVFALNKGESATLSVGGSVSISCKEETAIATGGSGGTNATVYSQQHWISPGTGGSGGTASGGNVANLNGNAGGNGHYYEDPDAAWSAYGVGASNGYSGYYTTGGTGNNSSASPNYAYIVVLRGNTNIPSPSAASTLSLTPRNASIEASWTKSEDPESVGTIVVVNSDHEPSAPDDGISADVADATTYTISDLPNDAPTYVSLFAYNADKTKYSAAKSDVEIPREATWYDVQEDLKEDIADAQEDAEQAQEVVLLTRDFLPDAIAITVPEIYDEWNPDGIAYIGKDTAK